MQAMVNWMLNVVDNVAGRLAAWWREDSEATTIVSYL